MKRKFMSATLSFFVALSLVSSRTLQLYAEEEQTEENNEEITEEEVVSEGEAVTPEEEAPAPEEETIEPEEESVSEEEPAALSDTDTDEIDLKDETASVYFDYDGHFIYPGQQVEIPIIFHMPDSSYYTKDIRVGGYENMESSTDFDVEFTEGEDFTFSDGILHLNMDSIVQKWSGEIAVYAAVNYYGYLYCSETFYLYLTEPIEEYTMHGDDQMVPGMMSRIENWDIVYVENGEYPNGIAFDYDVLNAELINEQPAEAGKKVLELTEITPEMDPNHPGWDYEALNNGEADIRITYRKLSGEEDSYTFHVTVKSDVYTMRIVSESGSTQFLPGSEETLFAFTGHMSSDPERDGDLSGLSYVWSIESWDEPYLSIEQNQDEPWSAHVVFNDDDLMPDMVTVFVNCKMYDEEGNLLADEDFMMDISKDYLEVYPTFLDNPAGSGGEVTFTAEIRHFKYGTEGYEVAENAEFFWGYDPEVIEVLDEEGNVVGNSDEPIVGSSVVFTVRRKKPWMTNLHMEAYLEREDGSSDRFIRDFWFDENFYNVRLESDTDRLYTDGDLEYRIRMEGDFGEEGTDYTRMIKIGYYDEEAEQEVVFEEGNEYSLEGDSIILHGTKMAGKNYDHISVIVEIQMNGEPVTFDIRDCWIEELREDYDREYDRNLLRGWDGQVNNSYSVYIENSEYPDGWDTEYFVKDVKIVREDPWEDGEQVLTLEKMTDEENPDDYWWHYRAVEHGEAELEVTYTDIDGNEQKYRFTLHVGTDVYNIDLRAKDGIYRSLPGGTLELTARGWRDSEEDNSMETAFFEWKIEDGEENAQLQVDPDDPNHAFVTFRELDDNEENIWEDVLVSVRLFDGVDDEGNPCERAYRDVRLNMSDYYADILPGEINEELLPGESETITAELFSYDPDHKDGELIEKDVHFRWYYDEEAVAVTDADGNKVGNNDSEGMYIDSEKSYGNEAEFTITKLKNWHTQVTLVAEWTDEWGNFREERRDYQLTDVWYNVFFDPHDYELFDDYEATAVLNVDELEGKDYTIVYEAGVNSEDGWIVTFDEGTDYTTDGNTITVYGSSITGKLPSDRRDLDVIAKIMVGENQIGENWAHFDVREACGNHQWITSTVKEPTTEEPGLKVSICRICHEERTEEIPPLPKVKPTKIAFADQKLEMPTEETKKLQLVTTPAGADDSAEWTSSNEKAATVDENGVITAKTYGKTTITAVSKADPKLKATITVQTRFYDVNDSTQSYYKPVYWGADNGVVAGYDGGVYFGPDNDCTRAQFVTFLWRLAGRQTGDKDVSFPDVDPNESYYRAVKWAVSEGIIVGYKHEDGPATFEPNGTVTRGQVATMLWRFAGRKTPDLPSTSPFSDIDASNSSYRAVVWGQKAGVIKGYKDGTFQPDASCLRQHIVTFLYRYARDVMKINVN